jgi:hypothetical protein
MPSFFLTRREDVFAPDDGSLANSTLETSEVP